MAEYAFTRELDLDFESAVERVKERLQNEGFGVVMTLDMKQVFTEKLAVEFRRYLILGVCDPVNACKAIMAEEGSGLMLPCSVIVYESAAGTTVEVIGPTAATRMVDNLDLHRITKDVERRLKGVLDALQPAVHAG